MLLGWHRLVRLLTALLASPPSSSALVHARFPALLALSHLALLQADTWLPLLLAHGSFTGGCAERLQPLRFITSHNAPRPGGMAGHPSCALHINCWVQAARTHAAALRAGAGGRGIICLSSAARVPLLLAAVSVFGPGPVAATVERKQCCSRSFSAARHPPGIDGMGDTNQNYANPVSQVCRAQVVCFDVDSTVTTMEGIDELAQVAGVYNVVQNITSAAMDGAMTFHTALRKRLDIIKPSRELLTKTLTLRPPSQHLSPNVRQLVALLHSRQVAVYLVSGGFKEMIEPVARELGIEMDNVYANSLLWDHNGQYLSFDPQSFTAAEGGKRRAIEHIRQLHASGPRANGHGIGSGKDRLVIVHIGDGATDAQARDDGSGAGGADIFIAYGGTKQRDSVRQAADLYISNFQELVHVLEGQRPVDSRVAVD